MLEVDYLRRPAFSGSLAVAFAAYFGVFSIFFLTALYLQVVLGYTAIDTASLFVPMALAMIVASSFAGRWVARSGPRLPVAVGCLAAGSGVILTDVALAGEVTFLPLMTALMLAGVGFGIAVVPITSVALSSLPARHSGMAASATTTSREVGTVVGVAALGSLFNTQLINFLTERLTQLEVPPEYQDFVITAVITGQIPSGAEGRRTGGHLWPHSRQGDRGGLRRRPQRGELLPPGGGRRHPRLGAGRLGDVRPAASLDRVGRRATARGSLPAGPGDLYSAPSPAAPATQ